MSEDLRQQSCTDFQNEMAELIAAGVDLNSHPHVKACELCRALIRDIHRIAAKAGHGRFGGEEE